MGVTIMKNSLINMLLQAGYPKENIFHHGSDLYIFATPLTTRVLEEWCVANGWNKCLVKEEGFLFSKFKDQITGRFMYDAAFQYETLENLLG